MATVGNSVKSKRPADSAFKQQRLPAWQPILTAGTVLPTFFIIGLAFIPIGIGLLYFSDEVKEKIVEYTYCKSVTHPFKQCAEIIANNSKNPCHCEVQFTIDTDMKKDVYIYYGLSNFYQNHRRYVKSRDDQQLLGKLSSSPSADCEPFAYVDGKPIAPCGAIANSLFNDTLEIFSHALNQNIPVFKTGIAWPSDKEIKFRNPPGNLQQDFAQFAKPVAWSKPVYELDTDPSNNGFQNEDFIVWMRTAALPSFRKLYRRVDHSKEGYLGGLSKGNYTLKVDYNYGVVEFGGSKRLVISNTSILGGKNPFLGIAYIVVGGVCLMLALMFLIIHIKCGKSATEVLNVNPNTPYQ